jgi:DNA topoisomerase-1
MKKLVIVESPAKARTIGRIVGSEYVVKASVGHVRDLPEHSLGIKISDNDTLFEPLYVVANDKKHIVAELKKSAKGCSEIFLASDPDREGEAIAWHLREILKDAKGKSPEKKFHRIQYNEITPAAVRRAFENPGELDQNLIDAQQARRILDRLVGYKVSASLWRQVGRGLSAGRVQSVGLRLLCEREAEIEAFTSTPYWIFGAQLAKRIDPKTPFTVKLRNIDEEKADVLNEELALRVEKALDNGEFSVEEVAVTQKKRRPYAPFITSTLQQSASNALGYAPSVTMSLAQNLYEGVDLGGDGSVGLITYMRTDSFNISQEAIDAARKFIVEKFGEEYSQKTPRAFKNRKAAQGAHEAIRPTDPARTPESLANKLKPQALKLYDLIWRRFIASQMTDSVSDVTTVRISAVTSEEARKETDIHELKLSASSSKIVFPGFTKVSDIAKPSKDKAEKDDDDDTQDSLPPLEKGELLDRLSITSERKETKPPPHYNEASLVKALEANGIGRPSTYASIITTLLTRKYVNRSKRNLIPTDLGKKVNEFLVEKYNDLFNVEFTARMENELDEVEDPDKTLDWQGMLVSFYSNLKTWLENAKPPEADPEIVAATLEKFKEVKEWIPPVKSGRRVFSDENFVKDIDATFHGKETARAASRKKKKKTAEPAATEGSDDSTADVKENAESNERRAVSQNQLNALLSIMARYRNQILNFEDFLKSIGRSDVLEDESLQPPRKSTVRIFELMDKAGPPKGSEKFYSSLREQINHGKRLSDKQRHFLERMFLECSANIEGFSDELCKELEISAEPPPPVDTAKAEALLGGLGHVTAWEEPTKKGKRVFDDADFYNSVATQFAVKQRLSEAQMRVLERMFLNYKEQIPGADKTIATHDIKVQTRKTRKPRGKTANGK